MAITSMPVNQTKCSLRVRKHSCNSYTVLYTPWSNLAAMYGKPDWIKICLLCAIGPCAWLYYPESQTVIYRITRLRLPPETRLPYHLLGPETHTIQRHRHQADKWICLKADITKTRDAVAYKTFW